MQQYRHEGTSPECQWNGPSWPFQTTLVLGGMANLLNDWYAVNFGGNKTFSSVGLNFYGDSSSFSAPTNVDLQYWTGSAWASVPKQQKNPAAPIASGENTVTFDPLTTTQLRAVFTNPLPRSVALVEFKAFGDPTGVKYVDLRATDTSAGSASWTNRGVGSPFTSVGSPTLTANVADTGIPGVLFNGSSDAYQGPATTVDLDGSSDRTVEVWAYNPALAQEETMVSWGYRGSTRQNLAFNFGYDSTWGSVTHYGDDVAWGGTAPTANAWHHLVYTYSSRGTRVYVYGKIVTSKTLGAELATYASQPINLGCQRNTANGVRSFFYSGYLNTVRVFGGALTPAQVAASYAAGPAVLPAAPTSITARRTSDMVVTLTWSAVGVATTYKISRSADGGQTWTVVGTSPTASFTDNTVTAGVAYLYRVQSSNDNGDSGASASAAAVASAYVQWKVDTGLGANADDNADPDGDGQSNRAEYLAGTNPLNGADALKISTLTPTGIGYTVTLKGKAARTYTLQRNADLLNQSGWANIGSQALNNDGSVALTDPAPPAGACFYRVSVSLQ